MTDPITPPPMTDLLPCPFCGSTNLRHEFSGSQGFIECNECGVTGPCDEWAADPICDSEASVIIWNRRSTTPAPEPGKAEELQRWGVDHGAQPGRPLLYPMEDGYWTPWHIATALLQRQRPQPAADAEYREAWDMSSDEGSEYFASAIVSRLLGYDEVEEDLRLWLAAYLKANALPTPETTND